MQNKTPLVSVVVPIYNVEKYLHQCLDSIVTQTYGNLEIILVDDGSTDASGAICDKYAARDKRITVIHNKNGGLGNAYNTGIRHATGKYIALVEPDDWIESDMYETMVKIADDNDCDIVKCRYYKYKTTDGESNRISECFPVEYMNRVICPTKNMETFLTIPPIWASLYNRDFLLTNNLCFLETPGASYQDTGFVRKTWLMAGRAFVIPNCFYHYRVDNVNSSVKSSAKVFCVADEWHSIIDYVSKHFRKSNIVFRFIPYGMVDTYLWNARRLGGDARHEFITKSFAPDIRPFIEQGALDRHRFGISDWAEIMKYAYPESRRQLLKYKVVRLFHPIYNVRIRGTKRIVFIFGIPVKTTQIPVIK